MPLLLLLFLFSGATGLVYELVWTRELVLVFGGTTYAITTVLVAYMAGLGFGSWGAGRITWRVRRPGLAYGVLELFIGLYALAVPLLLSLAEPIYRSLYPHVSSAPWLLNAARFCIGALTLLLPTLAMGATLPLLVKYATMRGGRVGQSVGLLYGINTLGATLGVLACGFVLLPTLGLTQTTLWAAAANLAIGVLSCLFLRRSADVVDASADALREADRHREAHGVESTGVDERRRMVLITCAASGFVAMAYQIAWTRALVMSMGSSTYSFTCILSAFILGLALGSLAASRFVDRLRNPLRAIGYAQVGVALSAALVLPLQGWTPVLVYYLVESYAAQFDLLLAWQFGLIIAITFVPTFLLGMLFPLFARVLARGTDDASAAAGRVYGVNTIGTILGSFLAGFVLLRLIGAHALILSGTLLNGALGIWLLWEARSSGGRPWRPALAAAGVTLVPVIAMTVGRWDPYLMSSGPFIQGFDPRRLQDRVELVFFEEGVDLTASVTRAKADPGLLSLRVNAKTDASSGLADMSTQLMLGHLPLLLHENPERVCVIGLGSGMTLGAVTEHTAPTEIDSVEISDVVIAAAELFEDYNNDALNDPRVESIRADGRNHLLLSREPYDVIISVPSNPWISGVANLFTQEYFALCRERLRPGGRLAFWMQGYMMPVDSFKLILRTAAAEFEHVSLWRMGVSDTLMIASDAPFHVPLRDFAGRMAPPQVRADLYRVGLADPGRMLGRFIASGAALRAWAGAGVLHTDDNALLEFTAPRTLFSVKSEALSHELHLLTHSPFDEVIAVTGGASDQAVIATVERGRAAGERLDDLARRDLRDPVARTNELVRIYRTDPGDVNVYQALMRVRAQLRDLTRGGSSPEVQALLDAINGLRAPSVASREAQSLGDVVRTLMDHANTAGADEQWNLAADYLGEAFALTPMDAHTAINYAVALMNAGRNGEAVAVLRAGVEAGLFTGEQLGASKTFEPLRETPGFDTIGD